MQLQLTATPRTFLQMLLCLRTVAIVGQSVTVAIAHRWLHLSLPIMPLAWAIVALALVAAITAWRLGRALPVTQLEIAVQLLVDILQLTAVLYLSGGTTNPFASLLLIPVAFAAVVLGWRHVAVVTLTALAGYAWLDLHAVGLRPAHDSLARVFDLHMAGMHVTFALSAVLLAGALALMRAEIGRRERSMARLRERALRHEHLHAMGLLAAGAAHELNTPLFSMGMLVAELRRMAPAGRRFHADLDRLERQIGICKQRVTTLLRAAQPQSGPQRRQAPAQQVLQEIVGNWSLVRPEVQLDVDWLPLADGPLLEIDEGFAQALTSLLHNAADASAAVGSTRVHVGFAQEPRGLFIHIDDEGPGVEAAIRQSGASAVTTKPGGFGLGLVLSHVNLDRLNGRVTLGRRKGGGTRTTVSMPTLGVGAV